MYMIHTYIHVTSINECFIIYYYYIITSISSVVSHGKKWKKCGMEEKMFVSFRGKKNNIGVCKKNIGVCLMSDVSV